MEINKKSVMRMVLAAVVIAVVLTGGCAQIRTDTARPVIQDQINEHITPEEAYALIEKNEDNRDFVILDVRTQEEFLSGYIENAVNLDYYSETFEDDLGRLDKNKIYLIYCEVGLRSGNTLNIMKELGFREAYNMLGGIDQWKAEGMPSAE